MDTALLTRAEVYEEVEHLVEANRARCLWFAPLGYLPATDAQRLRALDHIERRGNREAFIRARELRDWLLQDSSAHSSS